MQVFVTVGTTKFEDLIEVIDSLEFHQLLYDFGYDRLVIQVGNHKSKLCYSVNEQCKTTEEREKEIKSCLKIKGFSSYYYNYKPSLKEDMEASSLIITHGGSGSILETLSMDKPCICVVNERLMHNHQAELSDKLSSLSYVLSCKPKTLAETLKTQLIGYLGKRKKYEESKSQDSIREFTSTLESKYTNANHKPSKAMVILGSGGHTAEMFYLISKLNNQRVDPMVYVMSNADKISEQKVQQFQEKKTNSYTIKKIPRARNVGQSYFSSIFTTIISLFYSFMLVFRERPDIILCNGPGTCVPLCFVAYILNLIHWKSCKIVYFESIARVHELSLSGKILQYIATWFIVQWHELLEKSKCKNTTCINLFFVDTSNVSTGSTTSSSTTSSTSNSGSSSNSNTIKHRSTNK
ncbi:putative glycosyltransferase [Tieghemostelium lacteum]|uniref:UDP-N-acetylglucosamine transferase subunit ALG14 n=1 Tax=Tieghemostelium lacteum TaxID=361077 RepID=A0A152A2X6_TIELA|nr:putative glycosyltransferase [Tieghemostelium lacteum]|eukprot:KYR00598.1 putative glycosyltransferase [Tieghemostelium lacteum]